MITLIPSNGASHALITIYETDHLSEFEDAAIKRQDKGDYWWELRACNYYAEFDKPKIIIPTIVRRATFAYDVHGYYANDKTSIIPTDDLYLLGILNSKIANFVLRQISSTKQSGYFEQKPMYVSRIPIHRIDIANSAAVALHDELVAKVEHMLALHQQRQAAERGLDDARFSLDEKIKQLDAEIDALVYQLYGLTDEEIGIVEGRV